jgi:outer membrane protein OmpA-like peptidoglycan-associated protein
MTTFFKKTIILCSIFSTIISFGQKNNKQNLFAEGNTKLAEGYFKNNENSLGEALNKKSNYFNSENTNQAKLIWKKVLEEFPNNADANFKMGLCYYFSFDEQLKALPYFTKSIKQMKNDYRFMNDSGGASPYYAQYFLAETYLQKNESDSALKYFSQYRSHYETPPISAEREVLMCSNAKKSVKNPRNVKLKSLGGINSKYAETNPVMKLDNSLFFFSSRRPSKENADTINKLNSEDIYFVTKNAEGKWTEVKSFQYNTKYDEEPMSISPDGLTLYFMMDKKNNADIYTSNFKDGKWTEPKSFKEINTNYHESGLTISNDGKVIYFSSNRPGGVGGFDIYAIRKTGENKWSKPFNVGTTINTSLNEISPNLSPDGKSLNFSSDGYIDKCVGGFDIYISEILKDNKYSEPLNLGYPVNKTRDDINLFTSTEGKRYYSQIIEGNSYDILEIEGGGFDFEAVDANTEVVTITNEMNVAQIMETEKEVEKEVAVTQTIESEKEVQKDVEVIKTLETEVIVEKEVEVIKTLDDDLGKNGKGIDKTEEAKSNLSEIEERGNSGQIKALTDKNTKTIYFDFNQSQLTQKNNSEVRSFIETINKSPESRIEIIGYGDIKGDWTTNFQFSVGRAKAVYEYLIKNNISKDRMIYYGKGNVAPISGNETEESRSKNRRVEIIILNPKTTK